MTAGNATYAGTLSLGNITATGNATISGNVAIGTVSTWVVGSGHVLTANGSLSGSNNLTVGNSTYTGTLLVSGNSSSFTGNTTVSYGTLQLDGSIGSSTVTVNNGAALTGCGTANGTVTANGTITPHDAGASTAGNLTIGGNLTLQSAAQLNVNLGNTTAGYSDLVNVVGNLTLPGTGITIAATALGTFGGAGNYTLIQSGNLTGYSSTGWTVTGLSGNVTQSGNNLVLQVTAATTGTFTWTGGNTGDPYNWTEPLNWTKNTGNGTYPQSTNDTANFGTSANTTVTVNASIAVGTINFTGANYTISQSGGSTLTVGTAINAGASETISAPVAGNGSLTVTAGTLTLSGTNTFPGGVNLSAGQLNINSNTALGMGTLTISGGTIDNTSGMDVTLTNNNPQNWNANFTFTGSNNLDLGAGAVTANASRTVTVNAKTLTVDGNITTANFSLTNLGSGNLTLNGVLALGTGGLNADGAFGTLTVSGNNTFSGNVSTGVDATLHGVNRNPAQPSHPFGLLTSELGHWANGTMYGLTTILGNRSVVMVEGGNITLGTPNDGFGEDEDNNLTFTFWNVSGNNYIYLFDNASNQNVTFRSDSGDLTIDNSFVNQSGIGFPGAAGGKLSVLGNGTVTIYANYNKNLAFATTIGDGTSTSTLAVSSIYGAGGGSVLINPNATLQINANGSMMSATANDTGDITDNGTIVFNTGAGAAGETAAISGNGSVTQAGSGTLTLDQANTYTGNTTILAGTVSINSNSSLGNNTTGNAGTLIFAGNGTLALTANVTSVHNITVNANQTGSVVAGAAYTLTQNTGNITVNSGASCARRQCYTRGQRHLDRLRHCECDENGKCQRRFYRPVRRQRHHPAVGQPDSAVHGDGQPNRGRPHVQQLDDCEFRRGHGEYHRQRHRERQLEGQSSGNFTAASNSTITMGNGTISNSGTLAFKNLTVAGNVAVAAAGATSRWPAT